jgi:hypothetical protein
MPSHGWVHDAHSFYGNAVIIKKIGGAEFQWGFG